MSRDRDKKRITDNAWVSRNREQQRAAVNRYYANNKDKVLRKQRETYVKNIAAKLLKNARSRATRDNLDFNINLADIVIPFMCPLLGYILLSAEGSQAPNSPSLDRKDPTKGYVKGNVWVISYRANMAKNNLTLAELETLVTNLRAHTAN